jgi:hypothetical protein
MPAEARIASLWLNQKTLVSVLLIGLAGWFLFDGLVGYPRSNARYHEWKKYVDEGRQSQWPAYAKSRGWKTQEWTDYALEHHLPEPLAEVPFGPDKINTQLIIALGTGLIGLSVLIYCRRQKNHFLRTEDDAVLIPGGQRIPYTAIKGIGKKRWESKGIAVVRYELAGRKGEFIVDDYKFEADPSRQILQEIEEKLAPAA